MSEQTKKSSEQAKEFFKTVQEGADQFSKVIPDKQLGEKLRRVKEDAGEVIKHIEKRTDH